MTPDGSAVRVAPHHCLECGAHLDALGTSDGSAYQEPEPGAPVVCIRCGAVMAWAAGTLRGFTDAEMDELIADGETMNEIARTVRSVHLIRAGAN
jgi:hypothetical protein